MEGVSTHLKVVLDDFGHDTLLVNALLRSWIPKEIFEGWCNDPTMNHVGEDGDVHIEDEQVEEYTKKVVTKMEVAREALQTMVYIQHQG